MKIQTSCRLLLAFLFAACAKAQAADITTTGCEPYRGDLKLVTGTVELPSEGNWYVMPPDHPGGLRQVVAWNETPPAPEDDRAAAPRVRRTAPRKAATDADLEEDPDAPPQVPATARYAVGGVWCDPALTEAQVTFKNWPGGETVVVKWNLAAKPAAADDSKRADQWIKSLAMGYALHPGATFKAWAQLLSPEAVKDAANVNAPRNRFRGGQEERHDASLFNVLGGRAAVEETLQMQLLRPDDAAGEAVIPVASLKGVEVKAHPFEQMLGGKPGGSLALAEVVPADRFFVFAAKPQALLPMMDSGADFIANAGDFLASNGADHGLKEKYLARRGTDAAFVKAMLSSGLVTEVALTAPDLFFIDGTDLTTIARVPQVKQLLPLLSTIGLSGLSDGVIVEKEVPGGKAYWCVAGDLVITATDKGEVEKILALKQSGGVGSLGKSAEFRHMLTKLAPAKETRLFAYLSDPFIRRLTSPAVKIGQLRRIRARAQLEAVSAAALLYRYDGHKEAPTMDRLVECGYLDGALKKAEITLDARGVAHSPTWGTPARLTTLLAAPVDKVTAAERDAYGAYLADYNQYWREFFDPIAVRLDDTAEGGLEMTTFILPLVDSTIYNGIKQVLVDAKSPQTIPDLVVTPKPVLHLAANFRPEVVAQHVADADFRDVERMTSISSKVATHLRPPVHFWMMDSDPVIALGAGNLMGAFGGQAGRMGRGGEMMAIPAMLSALTRPCALAVEVDDPAAVRKLLDAPAPPQMDNGGFISTTVTKTKCVDHDGWLLDFSIEGMVSLHYGIELQGQHLIVTNLPWSQRPKLSDGPGKNLNAAMLEVNPGAVEKQLPALFVADCARRRALAHAGAGCLAPVMLAEGGDVAQAQARHQELFGYTPRHPGPGHWVWKDGALESDRYGTWWKPLQPAFTAEDAEVGLFPGIDHLRLSTQFEDDGLRVVVRWEGKKK